MKEEADPFLLVISGPAGTGKTTIAQVLSQRFGCELLPFSFSNSPTLPLHSTAIIEGKYAGVVIKNSDGIKKISLLFVTKKEVRFQRLITQQKIRAPQLSRKQIIELIRQSDEREKKELEAQIPDLRNVDPFQPIKDGTHMIYDAVINTSYKTVEEVVEEIDRIVGRGALNQNATIVKSGMAKKQSLSRSGVIFKAKK